MANGKGLFSTTNIVIFGAVGVVMLYIAFNFVSTMYFGAAQGASCAEASDCKGGAWCMKAQDGKSSFCTHACVSDQACSTGWVCGDSGYKQALKTSTGTTMPAHAVNVCWPGTGMGKGKPPPLRQ